MPVQLKRIYDEKSLSDGQRILVDRLWPRGMSKASAGVDRWMKEIAPSAELRNWFGHKPERWEEFQKRYRAELRQNPALEELRAMAQQGMVTLLYAAKDQTHNHALVLQDMLRDR
ncbi:DUF488 domain-containing protein [Rhizobium sp. YJ-22]|uniref:DUF488 domain-containing protein n=1 Tax=Rhizobium sp. YJ-22 TaxID=3037556 RepID=UPI00241222BD|nr:DUF488 domain-containing protein [Rhizobium sp. YJ-22]MDG3578185.1 DUF488 domain-containing protein [Rhizobium sp. YJ-22]